MGQEIRPVTEHQASLRAAWRKRWKKIGVVGFLLFLLKGIVWLVVGYLVFS